MFSNLHQISIKDIFQITSIVVTLFLHFLEKYFDANEFISNTFYNASYASFNKRCIYSVHSISKIRFCYNTTKISKSQFVY